MVESTVSPTLTPLVEVQGVVKYFPIRQGLVNRVVATVHAVEQVTFDIQRGETLGLVGESGSSSV
jgi:peptide/nickel transport system ATP-binding protein